MSCMRKPKRRAFAYRFMRYGTCRIDHTRGGLGVYKYIYILYIYIYYIYIYISYIYIGPARQTHALVSQGDARTSARARVRTSHARAAAAASTRQVVLSRQLVRRKTTQKACARRRRGRHWAARPRQTRATVCASRRAQCGARERPCRAAPALAVPT